MLVAAIDWHVIWTRIFHPDSTFVHALWVTIYISIVSQALGIVLGLLAAFARMSRVWPLRLVSWVYVLLFRGTPVLVQIFFFYFAFGLPGINLAGYHVPAEAVAGIIALSINEGAYMREIIRAGIDSIDTGQMDAAKSVGMRHGLAMRRIILPQALANAIPPGTNLMIELLKGTSLVSLITLSDLTFRSTQLVQSTFRTAEIFGLTLLMYFLLAQLINLSMRFLERRINRGMIRGGM